MNFFSFRLLLLSSSSIVVHYITNELLITFIPKKYLTEKSLKYNMHDVTNNLLVNIFYISVNILFFINYYHIDNLDYEDGYNCTYQLIKDIIVTQMIYNLYVENFLCKVDIIYIVHHLLVILPFIITSYYNQGVKFLMMFIPLESTNIFFTVYNILKSFNKKDSLIFEVNFFLFWISYTFIRIIYAAFIIIKMNRAIFFCSDNTQCPKLNNQIKAIYLINTHLLILMTVIWYTKISRGLFKISRGLFKKISPKLKDILELNI